MAQPSGMKAETKKPTSINADQVGSTFLFLEPEGSRRHSEAQRPGDYMFFPLAGETFMDHLVTNGVTRGMHGGAAAGQ